MSRAVLETWIAAYLADLAATEHRPRTIHTYRKALVRLAPELCAAIDAAALLRALAELAPATRALYLAAARGFDRWCVETERRPRLALAGRARVKLDAPSPKPFSGAELARLAATAARWRTRGRYAAVYARARLLYFVLLETGCRIEDALGLRWADVVLAPGRESVRLNAPKGRAALVVPLEPGVLLAQLHAASRVREKRDAGHRHGRGYVLAVDDAGRRPWSYRAALDAFQQLAEAAGVTSATPHRLRHSRATDLAERGASAFLLRQAMGWAKIDTAACYVRSPELRAGLARLRR